MSDCNVAMPYTVLHCPWAPSVLVYLTKVSILPINCNYIAFQDARYWPCRAWQAPRTLLWLGGGGVRQPSSPRECPAARGLSLLSQVKLWKPQPLITAWHRAPSGFRVACIDSRSLHWTWVWAKFKPCHRQFNSFLWGGNLMVNHNYRYN